MRAVIEFIKDIFDFNVFMLFLITSAFLFMDAYEFQKKNLNKEKKLAKFIAILYIAVSFVLYVATILIPS